jgi:hypothetical protein
MDRTIIPNGVQAEHPDVRRRFSEFCTLAEVTLVFVTGRDQALVKHAVKNYSLPKPDFAITDMGTKIYRINPDETWHELHDWEEKIREDWKGKSHEQIKDFLLGIQALNLQEYHKQNNYKLSYYLSLNADKNSVIEKVEQRLLDAGIAASLIWSIDEPNGIGLLDILPSRAGKLHAIEYLQHRLGYTQDEVVFAGDSGNDLSVLCSHIHSVLVANASDEIRTIARAMSLQNGYADALYIARPGDFNMDGNYSSGVLQGICHFIPAFRDMLQ